MYHMTEYTPAKTEEYPSDTNQISNLVCSEKYLKEDKHNSLTSKICSDICPQPLSVPPSSQFT